MSFQEYTVDHDQVDSFQQYPMQNNDIGLPYTMLSYNHSSSMKSHYNNKNPEEIYQEHDIPLSPIDGNYTLK